MKRFKKYFMVMTVILVLAMSQNTYAASTKTKAIKAYTKFLSSGSISYGSEYYKLTVKKSDLKFALIYLNGDRVPELVVNWSGAEAGNPWANGYLYTYKSGKVKQVALLDIMYTLKYVAKKGYLADYAMSDDGSQSVFYNRFNGSKLTRVSKSAVSGKLKKITFVKNTKANRKKYLK